MKSEVHAIEKGDWVIVNQASESGSGCKITIISDGEIIDYPETLKYEEAVLVAGYLKELMELPTGHTLITRGASLANAETSLIARISLEASNEKMVASKNSIFH